MKTDWKDLCKETADRLGMTEEEVLKEMEFYFIVLKDALNKTDELNYVDFELVSGLGTLKPRPWVMQLYKDRYDRGGGRKHLKDKFMPFFNRWQKIAMEGRYKIKGSYNPYKDKRKKNE